MSIFRTLIARVRPASTHAFDIAVSDMTDSQLRRSGLSKAEMLHRTFSGLSTYA